MDALTLTRTIIGIAFAFIAVCFFIIKVCFKNNPITSKFITRTAVFSAISIVLYIIPYLKFSLPFFPAFLEIHFDEIPAFIAGFAYGPLSAFFVILIKTIVKLPMSNSLCVGELCDFIYSVIFIIPASIIYKKKRNVKSAIVGLSIGMVVQLIVSSLVTSFIILDFYMFMMGISQETMLELCQALNKNVTSLGWPFLFTMALPFNTIKDIAVIIITFILFKRLHRLIDKIEA